MLKRGRKKMLAGHEHDHIVWRIGELVPVILASKRVHMRLHRPAMPRQMGQPLPIVDRRERVLIGIERHVGGDHHRTTPRPHEHGVGKQGSVPYRANGSTSCWKKEVKYGSISGGAV